MESLILERTELAPFVVSKVKSTGKIIGTGSYGKVEEVAIPGTVCVAKHIHSFLQEGRQHGQKLSPEFVKECKIMSNLRHPHIVQLLGVCALHDSTDSAGSAVPAILMEKMMTSLHDFLEPETNQSASPEPPPKPLIPLSLKHSILQNVASGLTYLHEHSPPIIHRDLSAKNVLLNSGMVAKIADLGMARIIENMRKASSMTKAPGASVYMPPEALAACPGDVYRAPEDRDKKAIYDSSIDVFSFGVVSIFVLSQTFPENLLDPTYWDGPRHIARTEYDRREHYMELIYQQLDKKHPLVTMITECLDIPKKRPSIVHIMKALKQEEEGMNTLQTLEMENKKLEKDADAYKLQEKLKGMGDRIQILEAEKEANDLNYEQYDKTMKSLRSEVRKLTFDNEGLKDQMKKFGGLQNESHEEIERLTEQLKIHDIRQQELKKCQEEVQAKTSQVKQYKKQHDGLVSKVAQLQEENKLLDEQFQKARNQLDKQSKKPKVGELSHMRAELEKQTKLADHYQRKSKKRKQKIIELIAKQDEPKKKEKKKDKSHEITSPVTESEKILYQNLEEENQELRIKVQELKKVIETLNDDIPIGLEEEKKSPSHYEELPSPDEPTWSAANVPKKQATGIIEMFEKETGSERRSKPFSSRIAQSKNKYTLSKPPNAHQTLPSSPLLPPPPPPLPSGPPPTSISGPSFNSSDPTTTNPSVGQYVDLPGTGRPNKVDEKHDDYVNQSHVQAMIEQSKKANLPPPLPQPTSSPPDDSCLPAPIMLFPSPKQPPLGHIHIPGNGGSGAGGSGLGYEQGVVRRGSAPAWVVDANPHEQQHQFYQYNQYGYISIPRQPLLAPQSPPTPPPSSSANQRSMGPTPATMGQDGREPSAAETDRMMREEEQRQGGDILTPGIDTAMHAVVENDDIPVDLEEEEEKRSPSHYEELPSPDEPTWSAANVLKKQATGIIEMFEKETGSERRSKPFSSRIAQSKDKYTLSKPPNAHQTLPSSPLLPLPPPPPLPSGPPPTSTSGPSFNSSDPTTTNPSVGQYVDLPGTGRPNKVDEKHDDYVNQSRVQAMIEQSKKANLPPPLPQPTSSPPDDSCLPAPIMLFPSPKQPPLGHIHIPGNGGSGAGGSGLGYEQGVERRGSSAPAWVVGANPHEQQHQFYQYNQYGYTSIPRQPLLAPQSPPTPPPSSSSSANQRGMGPAPATMGQGGREPSAAETDRMMREEEQRQGGDILTPGIDTAMRAIVENDDIPVDLEEEEEKRSPSHYEELPSPDEPTWSAANVPKKQAT